MKLDKFRSPRPLSVVLVLVLTVLGFAIPLAHASSYVGYTTTQAGALTCSSFGNCEKCSQDGTAGVKCGTGSAIQSPLAGTVTSISIMTGSSLPNQLEIATFAAGTSPTFVSTACGYSGQTYNCQSVSDGQSFTVQDVEGVSGLVAQTFQTIVLASPVTVLQNQWVAVQFTNTAATSFGLILQACSNNAGTGCGAIVAANVWDACLDFTTASPAIGAVVLSSGQANGGCGFGVMTGATFTASGTSGQTVAVTQCYGNCGVPAVSLANTNSTHSTNFNQSITLLYEFQSNVNGFALNVTTSVAKSYAGAGNVLSLGIYSADSCPIGKLPFSNDCPALLVSQASFLNPGKGKQSMILGTGAVPVVNGQWLAVAVTASFQGMDLNDTNTNVPLVQASGQNPPTITGTGSLGNSKLGLWTWIRGNVVSGGTSSPPFATNCSGLLDCILPNLVFSLCTNQTTQCQNASALVWALALSIISLFFVFRTTGSLMPGVRIPIGEAFTLALIVWIFVLSGLQLLFVWVPLFFFFIAAVIFGKKTGTFL